MVLFFLYFFECRKSEKYEPYFSDFPNLKEDYEELKVAYDNIVDKYYKLQEDCLDLEKKIDDYQELELVKNIESQLKNETEFRANKKDEEI